MRISWTTMTATVKKILPVFTSDAVSNNLLNGEAVDRAVRLLQSGRVVALPTDTIYGIACSATNGDSIAKLYEIKHRDQAKPIAICVADIDDLFKWGKITVSHDILADLLPGPVTLVFERLNTLSHKLNPGTSLVGIRIPDNDFIRNVARRCGFPLALTSANISTYKSPLNVTEFKELWPHLDGIFDGGELGLTEAQRLGSTVVDLSEPGRYHVIRDGCALQLVKQVFEKYKLKPV